MPIIANIKSSKFAPQIRLFDTINGTNKLKSNASEQIRVIYEIELFWYAEPKILEIFDGGGRLVRKDGGSFLNDGFQIGESFFLQGGFTPGTSIAFNTGSSLITAISENGDTLFTNLNIPALNAYYDEDYRVLITANTQLSNAIYQFGLIENSEPFNVKSKLDGSDQKYYVENIGVTLTNAKISGNIKGWESSQSKVEFFELPKTNIPVFRGTNFGGSAGVVVTNTVLNYRIIQDFTILPYFVAGGLDNLIQGISPSFLLGNKSLKHVFECTFKQNLSDDDDNKIVRFENLNGSVGNYAENFNGFQTQYSLESINYFAPSLLPNDSLLVQETTSVVAVVNSANGTFTAGQNVIVAHSYLPDDENEYINSTDFFDVNFVFEQVAKGNSGTIISNVTTTLLSANQLQINFDVNVTTAKPELTAESSYLLSVILENNALTQLNSDRTTILLDVNNYDLSPDIPGLLDVLSFRSFDHGTDITEAGFTDYKGWIQDGYAVQGIFQLNRDLLAVLESFSIQLVAWKDGTDDYFLIQRNNFNVSNAIIDVNGNQQILIAETQGFKLDPLDQFNAKNLITGAFDGTYIQYLFNLGIKINWQDWLSLPNADTVFYDVLERNKGLNQNSSRYSLKEGYTLQTIIFAEVSQNAVVTDYIHKMPMNVNDFGEIASQDWTMLPIETFDSGANSLNGTIIGGEYVTIKATFRPNFVITPVLDDYYGIIRIDRQLSQGNKEIYEMSSIRSIPQNNLLIPLVGESLLKLSLNGSDIVLECRTNKDQIQSIPYNISARLGGKGVIILGDFNDDFSNDFFN